MGEFEWIEGDSGSLGLVANGFLLGHSHGDAETEILINFSGDVWDNEQLVTSNATYNVSLSLEAAQQLAELLILARREAQECEHNADE